MAMALPGGTMRQIGRLFVEGTIAGLTDSQLLERYQSRRDEAAFTALVQRHGAMVLGVCRAILKDSTEVEDAFQATFLVLIRKADTIRGRDSLGGWLHRVAYRVALQARADRSRRRSAETKAAEIASSHRGVNSPDSVDDLRSIIQEEIDRLPDRFRLPVILCDLNGLSRPDAARQLNWTEGAFCSRLTRARARLRDRLTRRGLAPSLAAGLLASIFDRESLAAVPRAWAESLARAASSYAPGESLAAGIVSATAARLAAGAIQGMALSQFKGLVIVGLALATFGLVGSHTIPAGFVIAGVDPPPPVEAAAGPKPVANPVKAEESPVRTKPVRFSGRVLDPDGKPFAGAKLVVASPLLKESTKLPTRAASGTDGHFEFTIPITDFEDRYLSAEPWKTPVTSVVALADAFAPGFSRYAGDGAELTLRLSRDDVLVRGQVVDLQGKPVPDVSISVNSVQASEDGTLDAWLKMIEEQKVFYLGDASPLSRQLYLRRISPLIAPTRTDAEGRFVIRGVGRERLVELQVDGPTIESARVFVRTRPGQALRVPSTRFPELKETITVYPASLVHAAGPTRQIEGTVRDRKTGRPLAGIAIIEDRRSGDQDGRPSAVTDAQGHYRLTGLARNGSKGLVALSPSDAVLLPLREPVRYDAADESLPYLPALMKRPTANPTGGDMEPLRVDFDLDRGIWVTGKILDRTTGKPTSGAVEYYVDAENIHLKGSGGNRYFGLDEVGRLAVPDGTFRLIAMPGRGYLTARVFGGRYLLGAGAESLKPRMKNGSIRCQSGFLFPGNYNTVVEIDPAEGAASLAKDLLLERGRSVKLLVLDPDGKPLSDLTISGLNGHRFLKEQEPNLSTFTVDGLVAGEKRRVTVKQKARKLVGQIIIDADVKEPVSLTLQPWATVTGRVVDDEGEPVDGGDLMTNSFSLDNHYVVGFSITEFGRDGRFRLDGLIPGRPFTYEVGYSPKNPKGGVIFSDLTLKPGETRDLGDIRPVPKKGP